VTEGVVAEPDVAASPVAGGHGPFDQAGSFEHVEVVGQQVACEPEPLGQGGGREVGSGQLVDDRQPDRLAEGGMHGRPPCHGLVHARTIQFSIY
jgi:hypothetical protein